MKRNPTSPLRLSRYYLAALLIGPLPALAQSIPNPSFEDSANFINGPGYITSGSPANGPINGWTASHNDRTGINPSGTTPFADNGAIPNGAKVAFLQAVSGAVPKLETTATGLTPGTKYHISFRTNARNNTAGQLPHLVFSTPGSGSPTVTAEIQRVATAINTTPYRYVGYDFTATGTEQLIRIENTKNADHTLLLDDFKIAASQNAWSTIAWTGDSTDIFDASYAYTHAYNFNGPFVRVNNVAFLPATVSQAGYFTLSGLNSTHGGLGATENLVTGSSKTLAGPFIYGGDPGITLQNLKPNTTYVASIYGVAWDTLPYNRSATFTSNVAGSEPYTVNLDQFNRGNGLIVQYKYTTDALGTPVTISYPPLSSSASAGTFHTSGFSNREATPSTPSDWTASPWTNDSDSGVSSTQPYTHAYKFGAAGNFNLNGVAFTGVAGANPSATGASAFTTSGLPSVFGGDVNEVTGGGAPLAKDFLYGGFPSTFNVSGLTPGKQYVFTLYTVGWNDGLREASLTGPGSSRNVLDQSALGDNKGTRFEYTYTAPANGTANFVIYGRDGVKSIHCYGFSNRATDPFVDKAPEITAQPVGANVGVGFSHTLRVGALGSPGMTYQWKKGTQDVPGATGPELVLANVTSGDAGDYTVVITNSVTSVTSNVASVVVRENAPGNFSTGIGPDGLARAAGQIDPNFKIIVNPDNPDSEVAYVQSGLPGSWLPNSATSVWIGPRQVTQFAKGAPVQDGTVEPAGTYVYRMTVDLTNFDLNTVTLSGRWSSDNAGTAIRVNGQALTGFTNTVGNTFANWVPFTVDNAAVPGGWLSGPNTVDFVVNNLTEGYTGLRVDQVQVNGQLPPNTAPHIGIQPQSLTGPHGATVLLGVGASGTSPLGYQWYKGNTPLDGETGRSLAVQISDLTSGGDFKVAVSNSVTTVQSAVATINVTNAVPVVTADLLDTPKDTPLEITPIFDLLNNDTDGDGDLLALHGFSATTSKGGTVVQNLDVLTYTPPAGFEGIDTFTYTVDDGLWGGVSPAGTVTIVVGNAAVAAPQGLGVALSGGDIVANFTGTPGGSYTLQRSITLAADSWVDVDTDTASAQGAVQLTDQDPPLPKAFYRISYLAQP